MTNNPNPQQNKPSSTSFGQTGRQDANPANRQDAGRNQGSGETSQQFGGIRGGVEQGYGAEKSSRGGSQEIERCLDAIEENCRKLRNALSTSAEGSMGRSETAEASSRQAAVSPSSSQSGRSSTSR